MIRLPIKLKDLRDKINALDGNWFTRAKAKAKGKTRAALDKAEIPCLILPVGDEGEDPEAWLEWTGPLVAPKVTLDATTKLRARTLIDFFELDTRGDLLELRCVLISNLF